MHFTPLRSGKSVMGDEITAFRSEGIGKKYLYLLAGVHGDEVEGAYVMQKLAGELESDDYTELPIILIPILNIDGHRLSMRTNANGVDLNRNCPSSGWQSEFEEGKYNPGKEPLSEPENQFLVELFEKFPPKMIITLHSWKPMLNFNGDCQDVAELVAKHNNYPVVADIEEYSTPGSLGEYGPEKLNSPVLTYELPRISDEITLESIWKENSGGLTALFHNREFISKFVE